MMAKENSISTTEGTPIYKNKMLWFTVVWIAFFAIWFMPTPDGLTTAGQHAMAVVVLTIGLWLVKVAPPAVGSMIMLGVVAVFMKDELSAKVLFNYWTQETMWFVITCFAFSVVMEKSGLGHRLAVIVFSIKNAFILNLAIMFLNFLFSFVGMAVGLPKMALLYPILTSMVAMSGLDKNNMHVRRLAIMITVLANTTGVLLYTGFMMNATLGQLGGFDMNFNLWITDVLVPAICGNMAIFLVIYFMFRPKKDEQGFAHSEIVKMRKELPPIQKAEWKAIMWFTIVILALVTSSTTGIGAGFAVLLIVGLLCLPKIGMMNFKEFVNSVSWPTVFMVMGVLAFGALGTTGFNNWLVDKIMPSTMPSNKMLSLLLICFLVEILHIVLGSIGTNMALLIPVLAGLAPGIGVSPECISVMAYMCIIFQAFFSYQNVIFVAGLSYNMWEEKDLIKIGLVMFFLVPILFAVVLFPYYNFKGWIL